VLSAIGDLFTGATEIQTWLNICARLISKSIPQERIDEAQTEHKRKRAVAVRRKKRAVLPDAYLKKEQMTSVVWTTPLGLPICQPYRKTARKQIFTAMQTVYISDPGAPAEGALRSRVVPHVGTDVYGCSQHDEAGVGVPAELYPQSGCDAHDADGD
jgi:DNA-directed RNA polymerase